MYILAHKYLKLLLNYKLLENFKITDKLLLEYKLLDNFKIIIHFFLFTKLNFKYFWY